MPNRDTPTRPLALSVLAAFALTACEKAEPISYKIPKEDRSVVMPGTPANHPPIPEAASNEGNGMRVLPGMQDAANKAGEVSFSVPDGWEELVPSGIRKANLKVSDDSGSGELTVLTFPGDVGGTLANINRWRGQIGLENISEADLADVAQAYSISNHKGLYVRLEGAEQSILGALLPFHGNTWFFKLQGSTSTVLANEAKMKDFLDSVELEDHHH